MENGYTVAGIVLVVIFASSAAAGIAYIAFRVWTFDETKEPRSDAGKEMLSEQGRRQE